MATVERKKTLAASSPSGAGPASSVPGLGIPGCRDDAGDDGNGSGKSCHQAGGRARLPTPAEGWSPGAPRYAPLPYDREKHAVIYSMDLPGVPTVAPDGEMERRLAELRHHSLLALLTSTQPRRPKAALEKYRAAFKTNPALYEKAMAEHNARTLPVSVTRAMVEKARVATARRARKTTAALPAATAGKRQAKADVGGAHKVFDLRRWWCICRPQHKKGSGLSALVSCWNYIFSTMGTGWLPPITVDDALDVLDLKDQTSGRQVGRAASNQTLMNWFETMKIHYKVDGTFSYVYRASLPSLLKSNGAIADFALQNVKAALQSGDTALIYHCEDHFCCPVGYEETPRKSRHARSGGFSKSNTDTWLLLGDTDSTDEPISSVRWTNVITDMDCRHPQFFDIRHPERGRQVRSGSGGSAAVRPGRGSPPPVVPDPSAAATTRKRPPGDCRPVPLRAHKCPVNDHCILAFQRSPRVRKVRFKPPSSSAESATATTTTATETSAAAAPEEPASGEAETDTADAAAPGAAANADTQPGRGSASQQPASSASKQEQQQRTGLSGRPAAVNSAGPRGAEASASEPSGRGSEKARVGSPSEPRVRGDMRSVDDRKDEDGQDADSKDEDSKDADSQDADSKDEDSKDADRKDADSKDEDSKDADSQDEDGQDADSQDADSKDEDSQERDSKAEEGIEDWEDYDSDFSDLDEDATVGERRLRALEKRENKRLKYKDNKYPYFLKDNYFAKYLMEISKK